MLSHILESSEKADAECHSRFPPTQSECPYKGLVLVPPRSCRLGTNTEWSPTQTVYRNKEKCCKVLPAS